MPGEGQVGSDLGLHRVETMVIEGSLQPGVARRCTRERGKAMGGINCDMSNGRRIRALARSAESQVVDDDFHHFALLIFSRDLFAAQRHFLFFNEVIEDVLLAEGAVKDAPVLGARLTSRITDALHDYRLALDRALSSLEVLATDERSPLCRDDHLRERREGYGAFLASEEYPRSGEGDGFLPADSAWLEENRRALIEEGDAGLLGLHRRDLDELSALAHRLEERGVVGKETKEPLALRIRDADSPLMPFCLRSSRLWLAIGTRQTQWAHHNALAFRSVSGREVIGKDLADAF